MQRNKKQKTQATDVEKDKVLPQFHIARKDPQTLFQFCLTRFQPMKKQQNTSLQQDKQKIIQKERLTTTGVFCLIDDAFFLLVTCTKAHGSGSAESSSVSSMLFSSCSLMLYKSSFSTSSANGSSGPVSRSDLSDLREDPLDKT